VPDKKVPVVAVLGLIPTKCRAKESVTKVYSVQRCFEDPCLVSNDSESGLIIIQIRTAGIMDCKLAADIPMPIPHSACSEFYPKEETTGPLTPMLQKSEVFSLRVSKGEAVVDYCDPLIARRMGASGFPEG
jgi:hypothetical protein